MPNDNEKQNDSNNRHQPSPGQFYQVLDDGRYAFWFDAHTLDVFSTCEQKFYLKNVMFAPQVLRHKTPVSAAMSIGSWWSRVSELFYKKMAANNNNVTLLDMLEIAGKAWVDSDMDELEAANPKKYEKFAIPISAGMIGKYFPGFGFENLYAAKAAKLRSLAESAEGEMAEKLYQKARELESKTALALGPILMAGQYYQTYAEQDARDWKIIAAEAPFGRHGEVIVGETDKVVVYWQGKPDLVIWEEKTGVLAPIDQKTKDYIPYNINEIWKPHNQMSGYVYSIENIAGDLGFGSIVVDRCVLSVCGRLQPAEPKKKGDRPKPRFVRVRPTFSRDEIQEWQNGILHKAERLRYCIENTSPLGGNWIRNESACHVYSGCDYRGICSRPSSVRPILIQSDFQVTDPWTPFDEDED